MVDFEILVQCLKLLAPHLTSLRVNVLLSFRGFLRGMINSSSNEVAVVASLAARDIPSNLGANLFKKETRLDPWVASPLQLKQALIESERAQVP